MLKFISSYRVWLVYGWEGRRQWEAWAPCWRPPAPTCTGRGVQLPPVQEVESPQSYSTRGRGNTGLQPVRLQSVAFWSSASEHFSFCNTGVVISMMVVLLTENGSERYFCLWAGHHGELEDMYYLNLVRYLINLKRDTAWWSSCWENARFSHN